MRRLNAINLVAAFALLTGAGSSFAHIVLQDKAAPVATNYRAVLRVGHGCDGAATTAITVAVPTGFRGAQPMPKAGWKLTTKTGPLAEPFDSHGKTVREGIQEITWTAQGAENALAAEYYDEFVLRGTTPAKPMALWFKVTQQCEKGVNAWVEIPEAGISTKGMKFPAALLEVQDAPPPPVHVH